MTAAPSYAASRAVALRAPLAVLGVVAAATTYVGVVDPGEAGHYPGCPFLALTGLYCPFCGSLRAVHALVRGDLPGAIGRNALTVAGGVVLAVLWVGWVARRARGVASGVTVPAGVWPALGVAVLVFGVARNLPFAAVLAP
ncbi:MAG: DUF2752 domain-containing protein [Sporichthyaceae bacterium]